ncbi:MAG: A/G-specific adenine glycosylase [Saprospiraceae bacterium]|nr:A/G-specific adenine glycosylase [Saprospiraceae bacterium]MDW8483727.1 A/G-specific adenine glycosylase [Saprospiraceae bacterium]
MVEKAVFFREGLFRWHAQHSRPLPWKGERDPYRIWLSEIILQQTRVEQGLAYYERLVSVYPTVEHLARAPLEEVLKHWQGLGYYSRARNLHRAAQHIVFERNGIFPKTFEEIRQLKGVGDYTAAAIASFAFNLPYAVLDGNVYRVLSRFFGIETPINTSKAQKEFSALAQQLLDPARPGAYNQAIMDFGASCCRPRQPTCNECPLAAGCVALQENRVGELPRKNPPLPKQRRFFLYAVFFQGDIVWVRQRPLGDIWANLYEFALWEVNELPKELDQLAVQLTKHFLPNASHLVTLKGIHGPYRQILSHQVIHALFFTFETTADLTQPLSSHFLEPLTFSSYEARIEEVEQKLPLPKIIAQFWREKVIPFRKKEVFHF